MATLTGTTIKDTYKSLIKVNDNEELAATLQELTDGLGNGSGISINTSGDLKASGILEFGSLKDTGEDITIVKFVDQADGIGSNNNDTTIPTSAAVKDYVDTNVTAQDLDFTGNTGTGAVDLDSQTLNLIGANGVVTTASGQTITIDTSSLDTRLTTAEADIDTNTANIATEISDRTSADSTLQSNIDAEAATRLANDNTLQGNIDTEASTRSSADTTLQANIDTNTANISSNDTDIAGLDTRLTTAEGNITSNDTDIATNASNISTNTSNISTNTSNIATNVTDIATNATNISSNDTGITALQNDKYDKTGGTISGSVTISDDLTVNGTTTTVNTETLSVEDPLIEMANQNAANSVDTGFYAKYSLDAGTTTKYAGLFKDASDSDTFKLFRGLEVEPTTTINTGGTGYALADLDVAGLSASSGTISGDLIVDTDTLHVDSANNRVGIGTITPVSTFHLKSDFTDANSKSQLLVENESSGENVVIALKGVASGGQGGNQGSITFNAGADGTAANNVLGFNADQQDNAGSPDMVILGNGRMGIGTDSPDSNLHISSAASTPTVRIETTHPSGIPFLDLKGAAASQIRYIDETGTIQTRIDMSDNGGFSFVDVAGSASPRMVINSSGNVGVGTTTFSNKFAVSGSMPSAGIPLIQFNETSGSSRDGISLDYTGTTNSAVYSLKIADATKTHLALRGDGNLGIGTDSPSTELQVKGSAEIFRIDDSSSTGSPFMTFFQNGTRRSLIQHLDSGDLLSLVSEYGGIRFMTGTGGTEVERMRIDSSGNFGFNETPENSNGTWRNFEVGGINIVSRFTGNNDGFFGTGYVFKTDNSEVYKNTEAVSRVFFNNDTIEFQQAASGTAGTVISWDIPLKIDSSGNVGINNTNPSSDLQIASVKDGMTNGLNTNQLKLNYDASVVGAGSSVAFGVSSDNNFTGAKIVHERTGSNSVGDLTFWTRSTSGSATDWDLTEERMRIDSSGVTSVYNDFVLDYASPEMYFKTGPTHYRWMLAAQENVHAAFEITPSTTVGGTTYSTPVAVFKATGNVGIGTTSPSTRLTIKDSTDSTFDAGIAIIRSASSQTGYINMVGGAMNFNSPSIPIAFRQSGSEKMCITSGGDVEVTGGYVSSQAFQSTGALRVSSNSTTDTGNVALELLNDATGTRYLASFSNLNGVVGSISTLGSATSYNTSSDYRLKENVAPMEGALDRVDALKPSRFNFIADADKTVDGFLAHEVAEVVPEAISGEKDAVEDYEVTPAVLDDEGNVIEEAVMGTRPVYQGIDQSKLVPLLVGAIQELKAEIETLKSQIQ